MKSPPRAEAAQMGTFLRKPKGPTARFRAKRKRLDVAVAAMVRERVEARDGYCRYGANVHPVNRTKCQGVSEWAHFGERKRAKTVGMDPTYRHATTHSLMLCTVHHDDYDESRLSILALTPDGCDGELSYGIPDSKLWKSA